MACVLDYTLAQRQNLHTPGIQFFRPWTTAIYFHYLCIRKHSTKERSFCIGKTHHPHKFLDLSGKNGPFRFAGAAKAFKPYGLEQLLHDEHHRGWAEQVTAWGYSPKYMQACKPCDTVCS